MQPVFDLASSIVCNIAAVSMPMGMCWRPRTSGTTTSKRATRPGAAHAAAMPTAWNISRSMAKTVEADAQAAIRRAWPAVGQTSWSISAASGQDLRGEHALRRLRLGQRLKLLDAEGLDAAVLYPTSAFFGRRSLPTLNCRRPIARLQTADRGFLPTLRRSADSRLHICTLGRS